MHSVMFVPVSGRRVSPLHPALSLWSQASLPSWSCAPSSASTLRSPLLILILHFNHFTWKTESDDPLLIFPSSNPSLMLWDLTLWLRLCVMGELVCAPRALSLCVPLTSALTHRRSRFFCSLLHSPPLPFLLVSIETCCDISKHGIRTILSGPRNSTISGQFLCKLL